MDGLLEALDAEVGCNGWPRVVGSWDAGRNETEVEGEEHADEVKEWIVETDLGRFGHGNEPLVTTSRSHVRIAFPSFPTVRPNLPQDPPLNLYLPAPILRNTNQLRPYNRRRRSRNNSRTGSKEDPLPHW